MKPSNILHSFGESVAAYRYQPAVECAGRTLTYSDLDASADRLAATLAGAGAEPGEPIALLAGDTPEVIAAVLGVLRASCAFVPLDATYPRPRLEAMVDVARPRLILAQARLLGPAADLAAAVGARVVCLDSERLPPRAPAGAVPLAPEGARCDCAPAGPDDMAYIYFTSGSTGVPKGIAGRHSGVHQFILWESRHLELGAGVRVSQLTTPSFDAFLRDVFVPLAVGGTVCAPPSRDTVADARLLVEWIDSSRVELVHCVPSLFRGILNEVRDPAHFPALRWVLLAGEPLLPSDVRRWTETFGDRIRLVNLYGPSETTMVKFCWMVTSADADRRFVPIGRPIDGTTAIVVDGRGQPCPPGAIGEILIRTPYRSLGYYGRPDLTTEVFVPNPLGKDPNDIVYRTGDFGRVTEDGVFEFLGRRDAQVKVRGVRVEIPEVESTLRSHRSVLDLAVVDRDDPEGNKVLCAYVVMRHGAKIEPLRAHARNSLPEAMVPSAFVRVAELPRTLNGKLDRKALPAPGGRHEGDPVRPHGATEEAVAGIWRELLGIAELDARDNFFEVGGHSLLATRVMSRIREVFGVELPLRDLFGAPTLQGLAARVEAARAAGDGATGLPPVVPVPRKAPLPLSFAQERLWLLAQMHGDADAYNTTTALRLKGTLDLPALERALGEIVRRHEALRTRLLDDGGVPVQVVDEPSPIALEPEILIGRSADDREAVMRRRVSKEARHHFDLARGPLFRARLLRLAEKDHVLLVTAHHVVMDDWSLGIFYRELGALYRAFSAGTATPLPELPVQYADFAVWQREHVGGGALDAQVDYWREALAAAPDMLALPTDQPRPAVGSYAGGAVPFVLPRPVAETLRRIGRENGATLYMTLLAAFSVLLSRWSGQDDVLVGSPIAGRTRREVEDLIGFFVNTLVLRTDLSGDPTFLELLERVRERTLGAFANQDVPFERLVDRLKVPRSLAYNPLFQVMFSMQNLPGSRLELPSLELGMVRGDVAVAKFDLRWVVVENGVNISGFMEYSTDLFDRSTIERMCEQLGRLLEEIAANPERAITALPLLFEDERAAIVQRSLARRTYPATTTLHEWFRAVAAKRGRGIALVDRGERITYAELESRSNRLARHLRACGVQPGSAVGLCVERSSDTVLGILGVLKAGACYVPLDPSYPAERLAYMVSDAGIEHLLVHDDVAAAVDSAPAQRIYLDADRERIGRCSAEAMDSGAMPDDLAYVIYTSGSTGKPKGVEVTHGNVVRLLRGTEPWFAFGEDDVWTLFHSYAFDFSVWEIWGALLYGGRLVIVPFLTSRNPAQFHELLRAEGVTVLNQTPTAFRQLMAADQDEPEIPKLRYVIFGGEALEPGALRSWVDRYGFARPQLVNMYGITETTVHVTFRPILREDVQRGGGSPIGEPIPDLSLHLFDGRMEPVPVGVPGEIFVGGAGVARGYRNRSELTAERFIDDPFTPGGRLYRTGDLARRTSGGELEYLGRIDEQVKIHGFRIELGEIEAVLRRHDGVDDAVVIASSTGNGETSLVGYAAAPGVTVEELLEHLRTSLPAYMVPSALVVLSELPVTVNGKVDRRRLPEPGVDGAVTARAYEEPATDTEQALAEIWAEVLKIERVGRNDCFFDLGGHSLRATQVAARVRARLGVELPLRPLYEGASLGALATLLEAAGAAAGRREQPIPLVPRDQRLPPSYAQERLWFLEQMQPESGAYNMPLALRLSGPLDVAALEWTFTALVGRHESLRTVIRMQDGAPTQCVADAEPVSITPEDISALDVDAREEEIRRRATADAATPFDLSEGPLLRIRLLRLDAEDHVLLLALHHIVSDGWSTGVLLRELGELYAAYVTGRPARLPELPIQYADYAAWQRRRLEGGELERQTAYWKAQLSGAPVLLELPTDRPRPLVQTYRGGRVLSRIPVGLADAIRALSRGHDATLFMTLLAGFAALLARYAGQDDVVIGTPIAGRTRRETEDLIGLFVNTLALRTDLSGDPGFAELLARVRATTMDAYDHQELPFERVVEEIQPRRSASFSPIFQVMFGLGNMPFDGLALPKLSAASIRVDADIAKFDLTLFAAETDEGIILSLEYNSDLFAAATAERMLGQLERVFEQVVAHPERRLSELDLLGDRERETMLADWNRTEAPLASDACIHTLFEAQAARTPHAIAAAFEGDALSYEELDERANRLARWLVRLGVGRDARVGVCLERSLEMVVVLLGILKAGGAYVPLDPAYPADRLSYMLVDSGAKVLVTRGRRPDWLREPAGVRVVNPAAAEAREKRGAAQELDHDVRPQNLAYVIYTSGSTGRPKGVMVSHGNVVNFLASMSEAPGMNAGETLLALTTWSFDIAALELFLPLSVGATVVIAPRNAAGDAAALAALVEESGATVVQATPATWRMLVDAGWQGSPRLRALCGGEALPAGLAGKVRARCAALWNLYGPTETTIWSTVQPVERSATATVPLGRPIRNTRLYVLDRHGGLVPRGIHGELYIAGSGVARGYQGRAALTAERFVPDPFSVEPGARMYRTGDKVCWSADGTLEFLGRWDDQVKVRGFRIEPGEVESALVSFPRVEQAAVVVQEGEPGDKRLIAYLVGAVEVDRLRSYVRERVPEYMVPSAFVRLERMPLTPSGKLDRKALPAPAGRDEGGVEYVAPRDALERDLAALWEEVVRRGPVGIRDNFFDLGGTSLGAARLVDRVERRLGRSIPLVLMVTHGTVEAAAAHLRGGAEAAGQRASPLVPLRTGGTRPPLHCVHTADGLASAFVPLARNLHPEQPVYALEDAAVLLGATPDVGVEELATRYVDAIREAQPEGPYRVLGWSFGGFVAFEMARGLVAGGAEVGFVGILDTWSPLMLGADTRDDAALLEALLADWAVVTGHEVVIPARDLRAMEPQSRLRTVLGRGAAAGALPPGADPEWLRRLVDLHRARSAAMARYRPEPYSGRVTVFRATEIDSAVLEPDHWLHAGWSDASLGWAALAVEAEVHWVPGAHANLAAEPNVQTLARLLEQCLDVGVAVG